MVGFDAKRISIKENKISPYLNVDDALVLSWSQPRVLKAIHSACFIEVSARGIREVLEDRVCKSSHAYFDNMADKLQQSIVHKNRGMQITPSLDSKNIVYPWSPEPCVAGYEVLCEMASGVVLPSPTNTSAASLANNQGTIIKVTGKQNPSNLNSDILLYYHRLSKYACGASMAGAGRFIEQISPAEDDSYTVTSCDIFQNNEFLVFEPTRNQIRVLPHTYGPMAYFVVLFLAMMALYGMSQTSDQEPMPLFVLGLGMVNAMAACAWLLLHALHGIMFLTLQDEFSFVLSGVLCFLMSASSLAMKKAILFRQGCFYCLSTACISIYRTPENPYAFVLVLTLSIEMWRILINMSSSATTCLENSLSFSELEDGLVVNSNSSSARAKGGTSRDSSKSHWLLWRWLVGADNESPNASKESHNERNQEHLFFLIFWNAIITSFYLNCGCEMSISPQFDEFEDWIVYAGIGCFASFSIAIYYEQYHPTSI